MIFIKQFIIIACMVMLTACGGGGAADNSTPDGGGAPVSTSATGNVSTNTTGVSAITAESGAKITVPVGAVPKTQSGGNGTIAFSIEKDTTTVLQLPAGVTQRGDVYRFGPGGTVFAKPVAVTIPLTTPFSPDREYKLYRVNPTTGVSEPYAAVYDPVAKTLTAQTYEFTPWFPGDRPVVNTANGCVNVDNSSSSIWRNVCTQEYTLDYPTADPDFHGACAIWSNGATGWSNHSDWYLPQGSYKMCVEGDVNGVPAHSEVIPLAITSAWRYDTKVCTRLGISGVALSLPGPCSTAPVATPTVGTGALQISLTWHSSTAVDLDLYVVEPGGEEISYNNEVSSSGGNLDRDNQCYNYINGQSENIFWISPKTGTYTIKVHLFSNCSLGTTSMPFDLRVVNKGVTTTYSGTATLSGGMPVTFKTITVN
jgi:hypothetical protein